MVFLCAPMVAACGEWARSFWLGGGSGTAVYFPDDHRILHGDWQLRLDPLAGHQRHALSGDGQALLVWAKEHSPLYLAEDEGGFVPRTPIVDFGDLIEGQFDRSRGTLVTYNDVYTAGVFDPRTLAVRERPMIGGPVRQTLLTILPGRRHGHLHAAHGRWLVVTRDALSDEPEQYLEAFDAEDGSHLGSLPLSRRHGQMETISDRAIVLLDRHIDTVSVVDVRQPDQMVSFDQQGCDWSSVADLSESGRWLMLSGCDGGVHLVDLQQPQLTSEPLPWIDPQDHPAFAHGADQLVWYGTDGHIGRLDLVSGTLSDIHLGEDQPGFADEPSRAPPAWYADLGLLVYQETRNRLVVAWVQDGLLISSQLLPRLWPELAELSFVASDLSADGFSYRVSGELRIEEQTFDLEGTVVSDRVHYYRPSPTSVTPASMNRKVVFNARAIDGSGIHAFNLTATALSSFEARWILVLTDRAGYQVAMTLSRP